MTEPPSHPIHLFLKVYIERKNNSKSSNSSSINTNKNCFMCGISHMSGTLVFQCIISFNIHSNSSKQVLLSDLRQKEGDWGWKKLLSRNLNPSASKDLSNELGHAKIMISNKHPTRSSLYGAGQDMETCCFSDIFFFLSKMREEKKTNTEVLYRDSLVCNLNLCGVLKSK